MHDLKQQREKPGHIPEIQYPWKPTSWRGVREQIPNGGLPAVKANTDPFLSLHLMLWEGISWSGRWLQPSCVRCNCLEKGWKYSAIKEGKWKHERQRCYSVWCKYGIFFGQVVHQHLCHNFNGCLGSAELGLSVPVPSVCYCSEWEYQPSHGAKPEQTSLGSSWIFSLWWQLGLQLWSLFILPFSSHFLCWSFSGAAHSTELSRKALLHSLSRECQGSPALTNVTQNALKPTGRGEALGPGGSLGPFPPHLRWETPHNLFLIPIINAAVSILAKGISIFNGMVIPTSSFSQCPSNPLPVIKMVNVCP